MGHDQYRPNRQRLHRRGRFAIWKMPLRVSVYGGSDDRRRLLQPLECL